jgi:hypothetical protein
VATQVTRMISMPLCTGVLKCRSLDRIALVET